MTTEPKKRGGKREGSGPKTKPEGQHLKRLVLYVPPGLSLFLEAEEIHEDEPERKRLARRRKREAATLLQKAMRESRFI